MAFAGASAKLHECEGIFTHMSKLDIQEAMDVAGLQIAFDKPEEGVVLMELPATAKRIVLEDAVPSVPAHATSVERALVDIAQHTAQSQRRGPYGVVTDGLLVPLTGGSYVVDFRGGNPLGACSVQVLAYVDPFGRVFSIDAPTDVLSFPLGEDGVYDKNPATGAYMLGDIVLSMEKAQAQAEEFGHSLQREVGYLTVHSMLHLLGYDHVQGGLEAVRMREKEEAVMLAVGLPRGSSYVLEEDN